MLVSEYIVSFFAKQGIDHVFGYPGGMVTYLMDALDKNPAVQAHLCYHEQGAALAACGYGLTKGLPGVAYATSGPGATNLLTGIANAYFDSMPAFFLTGQVNTYDKKKGKERQRGFQETDIVSMAKPVTKAAVQVTRAEEVPAVLAEFYKLAMTGRKGPVLLDIPMDVQRSEILAEPEKIKVDYAQEAAAVVTEITAALSQAECPLIIAGAGIRQAGAVEDFRQFVEKAQIPVVTSMVAIDLLPRDHELNLGFIGAYGHRWANFATEKADLLLVLGSRMDGRQTGSNREWFAVNAKIIRIDVDEDELAVKVKENEVSFKADVREVLKELLENGSLTTSRAEWRETCGILRTKLKDLDNVPENKWVEAISRLLPEKALVTTDVGQNQVWVAQAFKVRHQQILFSGGHGTMGFSLPAAIGASMASDRSIVYAFTGDGGLQMNIQELQTIVREKLPIKIMLLNNESLGMIRHFQEMYFAGSFVQTKPDRGYTIPDFVRVAEAYGIKSRRIEKIEDFGDTLTSQEPMLYDIQCGKNTYIFPKLAIKKPIYDQEPLMDRNLLTELKRL